MMTWCCHCWDVWEVTVVWVHGHSANHTPPHPPPALFNVCWYPGTQQWLPLRSSISVWILIENWRGVDRRGVRGDGGVRRGRRCGGNLHAEEGFYDYGDNMSPMWGETRGEETESWWSPIMLHAWGRAVRFFCSVDDPSLKQWKKKKLLLFWCHDWNRRRRSHRIFPGKLQIFDSSPPPWAPFTGFISFKSIYKPAGTCLQVDNRYTACQPRLTTEALHVSRRGPVPACHFTVDHAWQFQLRSAPLMERLQLIQEEAKVEREEEEWQHRCIIHLFIIPSLFASHQSEPTKRPGLSFPVSENVICRSVSETL